LNQYEVPPDHTLFDSGSYCGQPGSPWSDFSQFPEAPDQFYLNKAKSFLRQNQSNSNTGSFKLALDDCRRRDLGY